MRTKPVVVALLLALCCALPLRAQTSSTGSIQGAVKDNKGAPLPGATVTVSSDALIGRQTAAIADERGNYRFPSLPPGDYAVEFRMEGFQTLRQNNVHVRLGQTLAINAALPASDLKENVTVTARAPVVSVVSNRVSRNFDQHYFEKQPLPNNFYNIVKAAPGVNIDYTGSSGSAMLAYGGTSESQNAFTLDGINVADTGGGGHWVLPSAKWMDEIEVGGLGADAEYGGYTGGVINAVTKSGGNEFHGEVEYLTQPSSWVGNNDSTHPRKDFKFNDVSITAGGPIVQDKLWFFASGEYWR